MEAEASDVGLQIITCFRESRLPLFFAACSAACTRIGAFFLNLKSFAPPYYSYRFIEQSLSKSTAISM